jgi:hypothetical protein
MTKYEIADTPRHAGMYSYNCLECGHEDLARPVFLLADGHLIAVGTGCAAKLTGRPAAEFECDIAAARLAEIIAAAPFVAPQVWGWFKICLPGRVTPKFIAETVARFGRNTAEMVDEIAAIYRAAAKVGRVRELAA